VAVATGEIAEVPQVYLEGLKGVELYIDRVDFLEAFLENCNH
jgi:hypothetical protein